MHLIFLLTISISLVNPNPVNNYKVNEGASTSSAPQEGELTKEEKCELDGYAKNIVFLTFANDIHGGDLRDMVDNRYDELEAYVDFMESYYYFANYGANFYRKKSFELLPNHKQRIQYLQERVFARVTEILYQACSQHFHQEFAYIYNREDGSFTTWENIMVNSGSCLCSYADKMGSYGCKDMRRQKSRTLKLQAGTDRPYKFLSTDMRAGQINLSQHHIIPLSLIAKFFRIWMSNGVPPSPGRNVQMNDCINILHSRLRRSVAKVMVHKVNMLNAASGGRYLVSYDIYDVVKDHFFTEFFKSLFAHSSGGNTVIGPSDRGPLDPSSAMPSDEAFEEDFLPLIGQQHWDEMHSLHRRLMKYVKEAPTATAYDRMQSGVELFGVMMITFQRYDITMFNENQWEERELNPVELSKLSEKAKRRYIGKKFWSVKNFFSRSKRSVGQSLDKCYSIESFSQQRWNDFFVDIMESLMESYSLDKSPTWSCILNRMYFDYVFSSSNSSEDDCMDLGFGSYLYKIASRNRSWHKCINFDDSEEPQKWCLAWRRIMLNSDVGSGNYRNNGTRSKSFHQDTEMMISWLLVQVSMAAVTRSLNYRDFTLDQSSYNWDKAVCPTYLNGSSLTCPNHCKSVNLMNGGLKKLVYIADSIGYDQEWFKDSQGKLQCHCSEDVERIYLQKSFVLVEDDSCDTPRCEDLR